MHPSRWIQPLVLALPAVLTFLSLVVLFLALAGGGWTIVLIVIGAALVTYTMLAGVAGYRERTVPPAPINPRTSRTTMIVVVIVFAAIAIGSFVTLILAW